MTTLDKLLVEVRADIKDLKANMNNAVRVTKDSTAKINKQSKILAAGFSKVRFAAIAATAGIILMGKSTITQVDKIQKLGIRLGESTENLSRFKFVAEQNGIAFETMAMAFQRMQRRVAEAAKGTGEAKDALKELGLNAENLNQLTVTEQFTQVTKAMEGVKNTADRTRLSMKLFDSEGVALAQIMDQGVVAMKDLARETPNVITQKDADRIATYNDNLNILKSNIQKRIIPILSGLASKVNKIFEIEDKVAENDLEAQIESTKAKISGLENSLERLKSKKNDTSKSVFNFTKSIKDAWTAVNGGKPVQEKYISDIERTETALKKANAELVSQEEALNKIKEALKPKGGKAPDPGGLGGEALTTAEKIEEAMINSTNSWSSRLTDAIVNGENMFKSLANTVQTSFVQSLIVDPLVSGLQTQITEGFKKPKTPAVSASVSSTPAVNMSITNNFNPDVSSTVRGEIANAAPLITQSAVNAMQANQYNGV